MDPISTMTNLLELRLDSITDMELRSSQTLTFENLTKLKTLVSQYHNCIYSITQLIFQL